MYRAARLPRHLPKFANPSRSLFTRARPPPRNPLLTGLYVTAVTLGAGVFAVYYLDARSALHRYVITPAVRYLFDAETGQKIAVQVLKSGFGPRDPLPDDERLHFKLWGQDFKNPVGIAAGFDKNGEAIDGLFNLGFSWVEIGSVTPKPQDGNAKPRMFHLAEDAAVINRYGFPSLGHSYVLSRLTSRHPKYTPSTSNRASQQDGAVLAVNLGKNKQSPADSVDDYVSGVRTFGPHSDVLVVNISSPNTPGLRDLQSRKQLELLLFSVGRARDELPGSNKPKLVLKIAPDLSEPQVADIAAAIRSSNIDGVIVSNTTVQRPPNLVSDNKTETGGLSGQPLKELSLSVLRNLRGHLPSSIPLIGCGGISTASDALEFAEAGASMVQIYTSFGYDGPGACRRLKDDLSELLAKKGTSWNTIVEKAVAASSWKPGSPSQEGESKPDVGTLVTEAQQISKWVDELELKIRNGTVA